MNFPINPRKATDAVARIIQKSAEVVDYLKMAKLVYLGDRESIVKRGVPIVGGSYFSMRMGPTIGEVMNFVAQRNAPGWKEMISPRAGNELKLTAEPKYSLSSAELSILDATVERHKGRTTKELVEWCHLNCREYEHVFWGRRPITVESMLAAEGRSKEKIAKLVAEAENLAAMDALLA